MNVAFLANSFHLAKTKSSEFFIELLREWFGEVKVIPHKDAWARLPGTKWDLLISWQHIYAPAELEAFAAVRTVLVPMYDDCSKEREAWDPYLGFRILSFSSALGNDLKDWGHDVMTVQYWQPVPEPSAAGEGLRGFFWPRTTGLTWNHIRPLLGETPWQRFHLHVTNALGTSALPTDDERRLLKIEQTAWFENPADAQAAVARVNVYFAPRRYEGIGQAVLEALALGQCVVAPNSATMNEYIENGRTGLLYDPDHPAALDFSRVAELGRNARLAAIDGRARWEASAPAIRDFLAADPQPRVQRFHPWIVWKGRITAFLRACFRWMKKVVRLG